MPDCGPYRHKVSLFWQSRSRRIDMLSRRQVAQLLANHPGFVEVILQPLQINIFSRDAGNNGRNCYLQSARCLRPIRQRGRQILC